MPDWVIRSITSGVDNNPYIYSTTARRTTLKLGRELGSPKSQTLDFPFPLADLHLSIRGSAEPGHSAITFGTDVFRLPSHSLQLTANLLNYERIDIRAGLFLVARLISFCRSLISVSISVSTSRLYIRKRKLTELRGCNTWGLERHEKQLKRLKKRFHIRDSAGFLVRFDLMLALYMFSFSINSTLIQYQVTPCFNNNLFYFQRDIVST